jgi:hypothetical protein
MMFWELRADCVVRSTGEEQFVVQIRPAPVLQYTMLYHFNLRGLGLQMKLDSGYIRGLSPNASQLSLPQRFGEQARLYEPTISALVRVRLSQCCRAHEFRGRRNVPSFSHRYSDIRNVPYGSLPVLFIQRPQSVDFRSVIRLPLCTIGPKCHTPTSVRKPDKSLK